MHDPLTPPQGFPPGWRDRLLTVFRKNNWRGFIPLYDLLKPLGRQRSLRVVTRYGSQFLLNPWDTIDSQVIAHGFYESEVLDAIASRLSAQAVLWVIGANFGLHAITAKYLHPEITVVAFEPSPLMAQRLIENSAINNVSIDLHPYALTNRSGARPFFANASGNPGVSTLFPVEQWHYEYRFFVAGVLPSALIESGLAPLPSVIILDAEGSEAAILQGFGDLLRSPRIEAIVFEAGNGFLELEPRDEVRTCLEQAGFREITRLPRNEPTAHNLSNFLAVR